MKTYRLKEKDIKNKPVLAVGYKVFAPGWETKHGDYCYADENGNVLNTIHTVAGDISECRWGLHFSKKPQDCFNFYESVQWNKFAKVEAYDACIDSTDKKKSVAKTLKIVQTYTFDEFIRLIQEDLQNDGVNDSYGVNASNGVNYSYGVTKSEAVSQCIFCHKQEGTKLKLFNKKTTATRLKEVLRGICRNDLYRPRIHND